MSATKPYWWECFKRTVRLQVWHSKISFFMIAMYYAGLRSDLDVRRLLLLYVVLLGFSWAAASYGYMINDLCDRSVDRIAGKPNALGELSHPIANALVAASAALGLIIATPLLSTVMDVALVIIAYGLATAYSTPPIRFKERGVWALLVAAAAQRTLPALIIFHALGVWDQATIIFIAFISAVGIRSIISHQIMDAENDIRSGVRTLASDGETKALHQVLKSMVFLEVICLTLFIIAVAVVADMPTLLGVYGVWLLVEILNRRQLRIGMPPLKQPPLTVFSEVVLPLALAVALVSQNFLFILVPAFTALWLRRRIVRSIKRLAWRRRIVRNIKNTKRLVRGRIVRNIKRLVRGYT